MLLRLAAAVLAIGLLSPSVRAFQNPTSAMLVGQASRYVTTFVEKFSNVVSSETYVQDWKTAAGTLLLHRESRGDFLLVRVSNTTVWQAFRDVFEVNGTAVRDRDERMTKLLLQPSAEATKQMEAIAKESARYNISNIQRTVNHPLFVFIFLQPEYQKRFSYSVDKRDRAVGDDVWVIDYKESTKPTLIRGTGERDLPANGKIWIQSTTGAILRTELELEDKQQSSRISATFRNDGKFIDGGGPVSIHVPVEMDEQYIVKGNAGKITGKATYEKFRQFGIETKEQFNPDSRF